MLKKVEHFILSFFIFFGTFYKSKIIFMLIKCINKPSQHSVFPTLLDAETLSYTKNAFYILQCCYSVASSGMEQLTTGRQQSWPGAPGISETAFEVSEGRRGPV